MGLGVKHKEDKGSIWALELEEKVVVPARIIPSHTELTGLTDSDL